MQEIFVKEPYFKEFSNICHDYRGPLSIYLNVPSYYILYYLRNKLLGIS